VSHTNPPCAVAPGLRAVDVSSLVCSLGCRCPCCATARPSGGAHTRMSAEPHLLLSCRCGEPQRTGARVSIGHRTQGWTLMAASTLNTAKSKPAQRHRVLPAYRRRARAHPHALAGAQFASTRSRAHTRLQVCYLTGNAHPRRAAKGLCFPPAAHRRRSTPAKAALFFTLTMP
jgi:hypothetical protein